VLRAWLAWVGNVDSLVPLTIVGEAESLPFRLQWLDELYAVGVASEAGETAGEGPSAGSSRRADAAAVRDALFKRIVYHLSPTEQLWLARILLHDLRVGIKPEKVRSLYGAPLTLLLQSG
jgi:hypothetical protein